MDKVAPLEENKPPKKDEKSNEEWGNPIEFLMTLLSFAVGLGNVWRYIYINLLINSKKNISKAKFSF